MNVVIFLVLFFLVSPNSIRADLDNGFRDYHEILKYLNHQDLIIREFLDDLEAFQYTSRLNLYSKIDSNLIFSCERSDKKLKEFIAFNERLQMQYAAELPDSSSLLEELRLQKLYLQLAQGFNKTLYHRRLHNFRAARDEIELVKELISEYEKMQLVHRDCSYRSAEDLKWLALYQQGKIHRLLAGYDLEQLDATHLSASLQCYQEVLHHNPNSAIIHSSLGFLYIDMGKCQESLYHHIRANELHPHCPEYIHGIAYAYYNIEMQKKERGESLNMEALSKADECFDNAIQLFSEFHSINCRVYLDRGKLKLLKEQTQEALNEYNKGLAIDPNNCLLLFERGRLLAQLGCCEDALNDLKKGSAQMWSDHAMHEKYAKEIQKVVNQIKSHSSESRNVQGSQKLRSQNFSDRAHFEDILKKCSTYARRNISCFISYAWNNPDHERWVWQFAEDLEKAGIQVILDKWFTRKGHETWSFIEKMLSEETDYIIVVGSNLYFQKYRYSSLNDKEHVVKMEARIINYLMGYSQIKSDKIIPILIEGTPEASLPPLLHCKNIADFTQADYPQLMFELIRDMYRIDQRDSGYIQLIQTYQ